VHTVCHIITKLELGGAQQNTLFTVSHLDEARFRRVLVTGEPGMLDQEAEAMPEVEFYRVPSLVREIHPVKDCRAVWELFRLLKRVKPTIVHTHSSKAGIVGRLAARWAGVPIVIHSVHGFGFTPYQPSVYRRLLVWAERQAARCTTRFIAVSEANRRQGVELNLFAPDQCTVIRSGVDLDAFRHTRVDVARKKQELGLDPARPVIGTIAPLKPQKAPVDFVRVAAAVRRHRPDAQFVMVGDGELRAAVERARASLGLTGALHLLGWRRDVAELHRCFDVFALTSLWEGLPRVYLEALASGVPVVGTRVDGAEEVVRDGVNGYLLDPGNIDGLALRIVQILSAPDRYRDERGSLLSKEFDIWEMVRQQETEYQALIASLHPPCAA